MDINLFNGQVIPTSIANLSPLRNTIPFTLPSIRRCLSVFTRGNPLKAMVLRLSYDSKRVHQSTAISIVKSRQISEIDTKFFKLKRISVWPPVNQPMIKPSKYFGLILQQSFIERIFAYMTPFGGSIYIKELGTQRVMEEFIPPAQKLILSLIYRSGIHRNIVSRSIMQYFSRSVGKRLDSRESTWAIKKFIQTYKIDMSEYDDGKFASFNDFFSRKLKPNARTVENPGKMCSPADCRFLERREGRLAIKGQLLKTTELLKKQVGCKSICVCRLAPQDYHRFHAPLACEVISIRHIQGSYHSVSPIGCYDEALLENVRTVIELKVDRGTLFYVAIGAALVGSVILSIKVGDKLQQMDEMGYFQFGGSCVVLVSDFGWELRSEIRGNSFSGIETFVRLGNCLEN